MFQSVGFIGTGNMGSAVAKAAAASGRAKSLLLSNRTRSKAEALARELPGAAVSSNREIAQVCELIFLGVKPHIMGDVLSEIAPVLKARDGYVLATMAAGLSCARIRELAGVNCPVLRIMPNTPAGAGAGVVQYCGLDASPEQLDAFAALLAPAGLVDPLPENLIDAASALSGCGPAYVYLFLEALADGAVACGLPRDKAAAYAAQTVLGAAKLALERGGNPGALKDAVCSPGGTTIQGVRKLEEGAFRAAAMDAVIAAYEKTLELGRK